MRIALLSTLALLSFAANSILCRLALAPHRIDPIRFATVRLLAGAIVLALITIGGGRRLGGSWRSAFFLFLYAVPFSIAYVTLTAGTGALIAFGLVQITMLAGAHRSGERMRPIEWIGLLLAIGGLVYLLSPGLHAPSPFGSVMMALAGFAWGIYSLRGRRSTDPLADTAGNFARSVPLALAVMTVAALLVRPVPATGSGILLAIASGAVTSGLGYVIWYAALRGLSATRAAILQTSVPVIAALGGIFFLAETPTLRLLIAALAILGGILLVIAGQTAGRGLGFSRISQE